MKRKEHPELTQMLVDREEYLALRERLARAVRLLERCWATTLGPFRDDILDFLEDEQKYKP
jgi:hypothetical protein